MVRRTNYRDQCTHIQLYLRECINYLKYNTFITSLPVAIDEGLNLGSKYARYCY
jgi:hypothetical protein